ncbi:MAG: AAA family ATPase [Chloroflexi bacterium]|nr:AAA family ATPase [Chloroflexota bacterium]
MTSESRESDFIGRQPELAVLTTALDDALSGRGQMTMLAGEPGIGKTRLAQELASHAESLGAQVMWGWCYEHIGAPPYWPYVRPIRTYIESADPERLSSQMGSGGAAIAEIVPELREKLPDLGQPAAAEPEQARFRLFDSLTTFLKNAAQDQPLVFVLDDLHWADPASLLMLEFLVREIAASPLLVLGTYRDVEVTGSHPLSQTLGNLVRERHYRRVQLGGLTQQEVGEFVEGRKGVNLPNDILLTIHSRTEGNPLFVTEVVELIDPVQITENRAWAEIIPEGVRDAIGSRLSRLSATCNRVLETASVIGREFDFSLLSTLDSEISADEVLEALGEALEAKLIETVPAAVERYQFGHGLIQQVLYEELSPVRRIRAHARIGETLERMHQTDLAEHAAELARHFAEAASVLGTEKLVHYSLMAGDRALATFTYEDALTHFERGLVAQGTSLSGTEAPSDDEAAALLFGLARAQAATFERQQLVEAFGTLSRAFEYYVEEGNITLAVAAAEFPIYSPGVVIPGVGELLTRALALVPADSHESGRLLSRYGGVNVGYGYEHAEMLEREHALSRALNIAQREGDIALEVRTLISTGLLVRRLYRHQESLGIFLQAIDLARRINDLHSEVVACYWAVLAQSNLGDLAGMKRTAAAGLHAAERLHDRSLLALTLWLGQMAAKLEGDWQTTRDFGDRGLMVSPRELRILYLRTLVEYEVGKIDQAEEYLEKFVDFMAQVSPGSVLESSFASCLIPMVAYLTGKFEWLDIAEQAARTVFSPNPVSGEVRQFAQSGLGLTAVLEGNVEAAQEQYANLESHRGLMLMLGGIANDRLLGLLSRTMGDLDQAEVHFEDALSFCRKAGYRPELAWSCCDYADLLLERNNQGNRAKATALLKESLSISSELGMRPLMERVTVLQERVDAEPAQESGFPDGLTLREVEVIRLVALGKTDREIAEDLFISFRTVGNHVRSILNKTGAANRTEAATYANQHGLVAPISDG